jgi:hypothetical protein
MLHDMDQMEASCIIYVNLGVLNHLEHSQSWLVTINETGFVRLIIQYDFIVCFSFMYYSRDG